MQKLKTEVELTRFSPEELSESHKDLIERANHALEGSYSPYSNFAVGAAILLENGEIIKGSNQENAAYPSGLCAERTALFYAGANHPNERVEAIAVVLQNPISRFPFPCGSCLQVISEYQNKQKEPIDILMVHPSTGEVLLSQGIENLLPHAFQKSHLEL